MFALLAGILPCPFLADIIQLNLEINNKYSILGYYYTQRRAIDD
jgi:hypothetical protein